VQNKAIEFKNPIVFVTYPTPGILGPIIARQMIESLGLEEIGFFKSKHLSPVTIFIDNVLKHPYLLYANKEGTILLINIDYPVPQEGYLTVAEGIIDWVDHNLDAKYIVCLDAIPVNVRPDKPVIITAAEQEVAEQLKKYAVEVYDNGVVLGLSGALMSEALLRDIVGIVLMAPATIQFPDPAAAADIINVINDFFSLQIKTENLIKEAQQIKEKLALIAERQKAVQAQQQPSPRVLREGYV
ncbi:MAG: proteasome assembly chaperone family protein, partial [Candidatus Heimdallarchaeaceae archaeon]